MKKTKTRLGLTKTTIRVLRDSELAAVQGGIAADKPSNNPWACFQSPAGEEKL